MSTRDIGHGATSVALRLGLTLLVGATIGLSSGSVRASAALVQNNTATGTTSVVGKWALAGGVTAGHLLVATVAADSGSTIGAPAGWTLIRSIDNPTKVMVAMYYIENCAAKAQNATETFTATGSGGTTVRLMEFSGVVKTGSLDVSGTNTGGAGTTTTVSTSASVSTSPELGVAIFAHQINAAPNFAATAPWVDASAFVTTANNVEDSVYDTGVTSGSAATTTAAGGTGHSWAAAIATFQEAPLYWRGGATTCPSGSLFTLTTCWATSSGGASAGVVPGTADRAIFDGGGTGNCALSATAATQAGSITTTAAYTGTITQDVQNVTLASDLSLGGGTFTGHTGKTIATNGSTGGIYNGGVVVSGGTFNGNGATVNVQSLHVSGGTFTEGAGAFSTNNGGVAVFSGGTTTFAGGASSFVSTLTTSGSAIVAFGAGAPTVTDLAQFNGGTVTFGSGRLTLNGGLDVEGATVTLGASASTTAVTGTVTVGAGTLNLTNGSATLDFSNDLVFTQSGGIVNMNGATAAIGSTIATSNNDAFVMSGGAFNNTTSGGALTVGTSVGGGGAVNQSGATAVYTSVAAATETFNGPLKISGSMTLGTAAMAISGTVAREDVTVNAGGTLTLSSAGFTFPTTDAMTIAGTLNAGTGTVTFNPTLTISGTLNGSTGTQHFSDTVAVSGTLDGSSGTQHFDDTLTITGTVKTGTASMTAGTAATALVTVSAGGTMTLGSPGFAFSSTSTMTLAGTLNAGSGAVSFAGPVTFTGTFNDNSATSTFNGIVTMTSPAIFNGNTGVTSFGVAPVLTSGTFNVGDAASTGRVTFTVGGTFGSATTLAFPTNGSELNTTNGSTLALNGTVTSSGGAVTTRPRIDCVLCVSAGQGFVATIGSSATLNVDGLQFDRVSAAGVQIANGATFTAFRHVKFTNNAAGNTSSGTHLAITSANNVAGNKILTIPGASFDSTAQYNVTLSGTGTGTGSGVRAIFENDGSNGPRAGDTFDLDADTNHDNAADTTATPRWGSVVEWVTEAPSDTTGAAIGFPTAAFDWTTFTNYGVYVAYKDANGTTDRIWLRNADGTPDYFYDVVQAGNGDIVGTPKWDTENEVTLGTDVNRNGNSTDTDVRVLYVATSTGTAGHIIKLIDNGTSLAPPASGPWSSPFTNAAVTSITSPLTEDGLNLYFGGSGTSVFGVQITGGTNEAKLVKTIGSVGTVSAALSFSIIGAVTYLVIGSTANIYRIDTSMSMVDRTFAVTSGINGSLRLTSGHAYGVTDVGKVYAINAFAGGSATFINIAGFPYQSTATSPIKSAPWVDSGNAYFGDNAGNLYAVTVGGANVTGYPSPIVGGTAITSSPIYLGGTGVIAVGGADGNVYFINRHNASNVATLIKKYFVGNQTVSSVSYSYATSEYMVSTGDGKLAFIKASDVKDPDSTE